VGDETSHDLKIGGEHATRTGLIRVPGGGAGETVFKSLCFGVFVAVDVECGSEMIRVLTEIQTITTTGVGAEMALIIQITDETVNDWKMLAHY
jgi:hypothetical protein